MVAVPEVRTDAPAVLAGARSPLRGRRVVAAAVSTMELLRPESDLLRLLEGSAEVDLLVATDDAPGRGAAAEDDGEAADAALAEVRRRVDALQLPGLRLHRLGLPAPLTAGAHDDLVAALSELVGFDPERGVYCLGPAVSPPDPSRAALDGAVRRIAQVYGIPLLRYRCLELVVVGDDG